MFEWARRKGAATALAAAAGGACVLLIAGSGAAGAAAVPGCGAFEAQGDAQDAFMEAGGSPARNAGKMDPDGDGVACEALGAPFKGYATIGYNRKKQFFYGIVKMPAALDGGESPCLYGNKNYPDASRRFNIYKVRTDGDKPLLGRYKAGTQADPAAGTLIWKVERADLVQARYYVAFDERVPLTPYGRNECPGFSSVPTLLPRPQNSGG
ncbi:MAG TPA: hypothetical protein VFB52_03545 [Solirubrobacterales bacterium]|nr:hypothetical protein [Solirubrobacterales bacterium]